MTNLIRDDDKAAGPISKLSICGVERILVTAVRNGSGNLELISWVEGQKSGSPSSTLTRKDSVTAGPISDVAVATVRTAQYGGRVVTAAHTSDDDLELTVWDVAAFGVSPSGAFRKVGSIKSKNRPINGRPAVLAPGVDGDGWTVTATRQKSSVFIEAWKIAQHDGFIAHGETVHEIFVTANNTGVPDQLTLVATSRGVLLTLRDAGGGLHIIHLQVNDGKFKELDHVFDREVKEISTCLYQIRHQGSRIVVTGVRHPDEKVELIAWSVADEGKITRKGSMMMPAAYGIGVGTVGVLSSVPRLVTAAVDLSGKLALAVLHTANDDSQFVIESTAAAGKSHDIALASFGERYLATAVRNDSGDLEIITWHT